MKQLEIIIAGFGGQGILSAGRLLCYAGMVENQNVSWYPAYGPEMRGGTANCHVILSEGSIGAPVLSTADVVIAMNGQSLEKFESTVKPGGTLILDSSLVEQEVTRTDIKVYKIPATQIATDKGNRTFANIALLGKVLKISGIVSNESFEKALEKMLPKSKHHLIQSEMEILNVGIEY